MSSYTVPPPQLSGMIGSSARSSAIMENNQRADMLSSLINKTSGGKRSNSGKRRNKRIYGGAVVAQLPILFKDPAGGSSQSITSQFAKNAEIINQGGANAQFDGSVKLAPIPPPPVTGGARRKSKKSKKTRSNKSRTKKSRTKKSKKTRSKNSRSKKSRK